MKTNVKLIVDSRKIKMNSGNYREVDPEYEAQGLAQAIKPLGRTAEKLALVSIDDTKGLTAFQNAGYQTISAEAHDLRKFIGNMTWQLDSDPPDNMVIVTTDPDFTLLCDQAIRKNVRLSVWAPAASVPSDLTDPSYGYRPLEDLLPNIKVPRVDLRLDAENLLIGLQQRGWKMDPKALIDGIKAEASTLGSIVNVVAYADWTLLSKNTNRDFQRELAMLGVETRYQVNLRGKNSADMKIADDISTLLERNSDTPEAVDVIVLGTCDRDFRPTVDRAKSKGRRLVIFSLENGISWELRSAATEVRYIDQRFLNTSGVSAKQISSPCQASFRDAHMKLSMKLADYLHQNNWKWTTIKSFIENGGESEEAIQKAIADGVLSKSIREIKDETSKRIEIETIALNPANTKARIAEHLTRWIKNRIQFSLEEKHMPYVDTNYLSTGMELDSTLRKWGVGQDRHEAGGWLQIGEEAGILRKAIQDNPKSPGKTVSTWWLVEKTMLEESQEHKTAVATDTDHTHPQMADTAREEGKHFSTTPIESNEVVVSEKQTEASGFPQGGPKVKRIKGNKWPLPLILQPPSHSTTNAG